MKAVIYSAASGEIQRVFTGPEGMLETQLEEGEKALRVSLLSSPDDGTHYIDTLNEGELKGKLPLDSRYTTDELVVTFPHLPAGTHLKVEGEGVVADSEGAEIEFEIPGTYTIKLSGLVEYLDETLEVTVG